MKSYISKVLGKFFNYRNEDIPSFLLHSLYHDGTYLPFTTSSLKFRSLACVCNDIVVNKREEYLEFGSGLSTIIVARLIKKNKLKTKITSIEEDLGWINLLQKIIDEEGLNDFVKFIHAPTTKSESIENSFEYNPASIKEQLPPAKKFDCVVIDGPAAWERHKLNSRVSNAAILEGRTASSCTIFIDNADRIGERKLVTILSAELSLKPLFIDPTFAVLVQGIHYNFII